MFVCRDVLVCCGGIFRHGFVCCRRGGCVCVFYDIDYCGVLVVDLCVFVGMYLCVVVMGGCMCVCKYGLVRFLVMDGCVFFRCGLVRCCGGCMCVD